MNYFVTAKGKCGTDAVRCWSSAKHLADTHLFPREGTILAYRQVIHLQQPLPWHHMAHRLTLGVRAAAAQKGFDSSWVTVVWQILLQNTLRWGCPVSSTAPKLLKKVCRWLPHQLHLHALSKINVGGAGEDCFRVSAYSLNSPHPGIRNPRPYHPTALPLETHYRPCLHAYGIS